LNVVIILDFLYCIVPGTMEAFVAACMDLHARACKEEQAACSMQHAWICMHAHARMSLAASIPPNVFNSATCVF